MKIVAFMNAFSQGRSGGDMVFVEITKRHNISVQLVTSSLGRRLCEECGLKIQYFVTTTEETFRNVIWTYVKRTVLGCYYALKIRDYSVVLGTSDFFPDVIPSFLMKGKNRNSVWIQHVFHVISKNRKIPFYTQKISFFIIKHFSDLVIVDNTLLKQELIDLGFDGNKIQVLILGINLEYLSSIKEQPYKYDGVIMGQLRESKGIFDLVLIWEKVVKMIPGAQLAVIGRGNDSDVEKMKKLINEMALESNIHLLGFLPNDEGFTTIKSSKVCVFPSHEEGFGIVPLECQALGVPVVAWDLPVFAEIFPEGMVKFERGLFDEFADAVVNLLSDESKREILAQAALKNAQRFNWDTTAQRFVNLCEEALKKNEN